MRLHFPSSYQSCFSWEKLKYKRGVMEEPAAKSWNFHRRGEGPGEEVDLSPPFGSAQVVSVHCPEEMGRTAGAPRLRQPGRSPLPERSALSPGGIGAQGD